jgi:hypothetical protein
MLSTFITLSALPPKCFYTSGSSHENPSWLRFHKKCLLHSKHSRTSRPLWRVIVEDCSRHMSHLLGEHSRQQLSYWLSIARIPRSPYHKCCEEIFGIMVSLEGWSVLPTEALSLAEFFPIGSIIPGIATIVTRVSSSDISLVI